MVCAVRTAHVNLSVSDGLHVRHDAGRAGPRTACTAASAVVRNHGRRSAGLEPEAGRTGVAAPHDLDTRHARQRARDSPHP